MLMDMLLHCWGRLSMLKVKALASGRKAAKVKAEEEDAIAERAEMYRRRDDIDEEDEEAMAMPR